MTTDVILKEAAYDQMFAELSCICELSCESYVSQIYMEDASFEVIMESGEKMISTLITFVKKTLESAIDHIQKMIQDFRIKFTKKKLEQMMSPEMKKVLEKVCEGKKIKSCDIPKLVAEIDKYKSVVTRMTKEVSSLSTKAHQSTSVKTQEVIYKKICECSDKYSKEIAEISDRVTTIRNTQKVLTVKDVYRFTDSGIRSLDVTELVMKDLISFRKQLLDSLEQHQRSLAKAKVITESKIGDKIHDTSSSAYQKAKDVGTKISDSPVMREAVHKAVSVANEASIGMIRAEQYALGFIESWYKYGVQSDVSYGILNAGAKIGLAKYVTGGNPLVGVAATGVMTAGNAVMKSYTAKNLHRDRMKLKEKADELSRKNDLRKSQLKNGRVIDTKPKNPDLKLR